MGISVKPRILIKFLEEKGFTFIRANGTSHHIYGKDGKTIPVPVHKGNDVKSNTALAIVKRAGYSKKEFEQWLGR